MLAVDIDHTSLCVHEYGFQILGSQCLVVFFFLLDLLLCFPNLIPFNYILARAFTEVLQWETLTKAVIVN